MQILKDGFRKDMERITRELAALQELTVRIGVLGENGSDLLMIARVHEYGATITAKSAKNLAIPLTKEAKSAGSPRAFPDLQYIPISAGYGYLVREHPGAKGKKYDRGNYDWMFMLVHSVNIPERSFIRASFDSGQEDLADICKKAVDGIILESWTAQQAADDIGKWALEVTRDYFNTKLAPPKSPTTQLTTTQYQPLFDTGRLYNSITYKVDGGGG